MVALTGQAGQENRSTRALSREQEYTRARLLFLHKFLPHLYRKARTFAGVVVPDGSQAIWRSQENAGAIECMSRPPRNRIMANPKSPPLKVVAVGPRCSIEVPSARAAALSVYLRKHGITSDTPEPSSSGVENITLHRGADVKKVQALLDAWTRSLAKDT